MGNASASSNVPVCDEFIGQQVFNQNLILVSFEMLGRRTVMEDVSFIQFPLSKTQPRHQFSGVVGICDGHGGSFSADWLSSVLPDTCALLDDVHNSENIQKAMICIDQQLLKLQTQQPKTETSGSTAVFALMTFLPEEEQYKLTVVNVGDSRALLFKHKSQTFKQITSDHKPTNKKERTRIFQAGSKVECDRVEGHLSVSRAFGDPDFKNRAGVLIFDQPVTALPDVFSDKVLEMGDLFLLASDGLFEQQTSGQIADLMRRHRPKLHDSTTLIQLARTLCQTSILEGKSTDNHSVVLAYFAPIPILTKKSELAYTYQLEIIKTKEEEKERDDAYSKLARQAFKTRCLKRIKNQKLVKAVPLNLSFSLASSAAWTNSDILYFDKAPHQKEKTTSVTAELDVLEEQAPGPSVEEEALEEHLKYY
jgi:protein phosphatase 2C family protein 2/3